MTHLPIWEDVQETEPGIFIAPTAEVETGAKLIPPVVVRSGARVASTAELGPRTIVGEQAVIDHQTTLAQSVVLAGTAPQANRQYLNWIFSPSQAIQVLSETE